MFKVRGDMPKFTTAATSGRRKKGRKWVRKPPLRRDVVDDWKMEY